MKFVSLRRQHTRRRGKLDKPSSATVEFFTKPMAVPRQIHTYTELRQKMLRRPVACNGPFPLPVTDSVPSRLLDLGLIQDCKRLCKLTIDLP
jgi:hypothetical protein